MIAQLCGRGPSRESGSAAGVGLILCEKGHAGGPTEKPKLSDGLGLRAGLQMP